jgi:hypothetical protein
MFQIALRESRVSKIFRRLSSNDGRDATAVAGAHVAIARVFDMVAGIAPCTTLAVLSGTDLVSST